MPRCPARCPVALRTEVSGQKGAEEGWVFLRGCFGLKWAFHVQGEARRGAAGGWGGQETLRSDSFPAAGPRGGRTFPV